MSLLATTDSLWFTSGQTDGAFLPLMPFENKVARKCRFGLFGSDFTPMDGEGMARCEPVWDLWFGGVGFVTADDSLLCIPTRGACTDDANTNPPTHPNAHRTFPPRIYTSQP